MRAFERVFLLSSLSPHSPLLLPASSPVLVLFRSPSLCVFSFFSFFFFLKRGQTVNSFVSLMHELRSCIAPRLPYTHRPSTSSVSPLPIAHPLPPILASPLHPVEIPYSHTRVCKIQSPLLSACKILPGALGRNLHFAKNRSGTTTALKLLNHMSVSRFFFSSLFCLL